MDRYLQCNLHGAPGRPGAVPCLHTHTHLDVQHLSSCGPCAWAATRPSPPRHGWGSTGSGRPAGVASPTPCEQCAASQALVFVARETQTTFMVVYACITWWSGPCRPIFVTWSCVPSSCGRVVAHGQQLVHVLWCHAPGHHPELDLRAPLWGRMLAVRAAAALSQFAWLIVCLLPLGCVSPPAVLHWRPVQPAADSRVTAASWRGARWLACWGVLCAVVAQLRTTPRPPPCLHGIPCSQGLLLLRLGFQQALQVVLVGLVGLLTPGGV